MGAKPIHQMTPIEAREAVKEFTALAIPPEAVAHIEERLIPGAAGGMTIRVYTLKGKQPLPVLVYFHGGGFVIGDLDFVDAN